MHLNFVLLKLSPSFSFGTELLIPFLFCSPLFMLPSPFSSPSSSFFYYVFLLFLVRNASLGVPKNCAAVVAIVVVKSLDIMTTNLLPYAATTTTTSSRLANDQKVHYPSFFISAFDDDLIRTKRNRCRGSCNTIRVGTQFCLSIAPTYISKNI